MVCFDLTKQVPGKYFDTFSSLLEKVKNKCVTSTFGTYYRYECNNNMPHVLVFTNTAPLFNSLSNDRFNVFEVINEEYNYVIRRVRVINILRYDSKFIEY